MPFTAFSSASEALLMSTGACFAAGGVVACAHAGVAPAPRANARATRSAISRIMMLLLGTSSVPTKCCHREQGRSRRCRHRADCVGMAGQGFRSPAHALRRTRLARDLLHDGHGTQPASAPGTEWERTPWHAVQRAAWETLKQSEEGRP